MKLNMAKIFNAVGRVLIGAGVIILLFVAYQIWGTNIHEAKAQSGLRSTFDEQLASLDDATKEAIEKYRLATSTLVTPVPVPTRPGDPPTTTVPPSPRPTLGVQIEPPEEGKPLAIIRIPKIGLERVVVEGTDVEDLKRGPGHYPGNPLPGEAGNAAIAGHRTTYGAPFHDVDQLAVGDEIRITTLLGEVVYRVSRAPFIVNPDQVEVLDDDGTNKLTLTACHPKLSAAQRIVINATLVGAPLPKLPRSTKARTVSIAGEETTAPPTTAAASGITTTVSVTVGGSGQTVATTTPTTVEPLTSVADASSNLDQGLAGDRRALAPSLGWGSLAAFIGLLAWATGRFWQRTKGRSHLRMLVPYAVVSPLFLFVLYLCFTNVDRLLPAY